MLKQLLSFSGIEFISKLLNWGLMIILPFILSTSEYGEVGLIVAVEVVLSLIILIGQEKVILRFGFKSPSVVRSSLLISIGTTFISGLAIFIFHALGITFSVLQNTQWILLILGYIFLLSWARLFMCSFRVEENIRGYFILKVSLNVIKFISVILLALSLKSSIAYVFGGYIGTIVALTFSYKTIWKTAKTFSRKSILPQKLLPYLIFGWPFLFNSVSGSINNYADRFFIDAYLNTADLGVYTFLISIIGGLTFFYVAVSSYFEPLAYKHSHSIKTYLLIFSTYKYVLISIAAFVSIFLILFLPWITINIFDSHKDIPLKVIFWIALSFVINPIYFASNYEITLLKKTKYIALFGMIAAGTNILFNYLFIPPLGLEGAALSKLVSNLILVTTIFFSLYLFNTKRRWYKRELIPHSILCLLIVLALVIPEHLVYYITYLSFIIVLCIIQMVKYSILTKLLKRVQY